MNDKRDFMVKTEHIHHPLSMDRQWISHAALFESGGRSWYARVSFDQSENCI